MRKFDQVSQGRSHVVETIQDALLQIYTEKNYYINSIGNIYYANIGVSAHLDEEILRVRQQRRLFAEEFIRSKGIIIRRSEIYSGKYQQTMIDFKFHHRILDMLKAIWYYIVSFDVRYSFLSDNIRRYAFAILRRLPHKKPICFD